MSDRQQLKGVLCAYSCPVTSASTVTEPRTGKWERSFAAIVARCCRCDSPGDTPHRSCAGTRERNSRHCGYCGADFTLYERDLNTVCPNCFARVSDRTRYCPQYAELLSGQSVAGEDSRFVCPMCPNDEKLASRQLGKENLNILECQYCTRLWIGIDSFSELRDRVAEDATSPVKILLGQLKPRKLRPHAGTMYRKCIQCDKIMIRRQCAKRSGVIVGVCGHHGI